MIRTSLTETGMLFQRVQKSVGGTARDIRRAKRADQQTIQVPATGRALSTAYEQLRVASENVEDHLLFQRAVLRFYKRNLSFLTRRKPDALSQELIIELTQAGYLANNSIGIKTAGQLENIISEHYDTYWRLVRGKRSDYRETAKRWVLESLAVCSEQLFHDPYKLLHFAHLAHSHFVPLTRVDEFNEDDEPIKPEDHQFIIYIAVHKSLLKSDDANVRVALMKLYEITPTDHDRFKVFNETYDKLSSYKTTIRVTRTISRNGAPLRIMREAYFSDTDDEFDQPDVSDRSATVNTLETTISKEYNQLGARLRAGVVRSIIFLFITKALIGLLIEIPYDILVHGSILWLPLMINLIFPPLYIAATALTYRLPGSTNRRAIIQYLEAMFYGDHAPLKLRLPNRKKASYVFNVMYFLMFVLVFAAVAYVLVLLQFNIVQGIIFFVFLSTASFLGYRLTQQVRELEVVGQRHGFLASLRDFLHAPFIFVGQRISYQFAKVNIVAQILDTAIELPLKTTIRLMRQWTIFLSEKKEDLL